VTIINDAKHQIMVADRALRAARGAVRKGGSSECSDRLYQAGMKLLVVARRMRLAQNPAKDGHK